MWNHKFKNTNMDTKTNVERDKHLCISWMNQARNVGHIQMCNLPHCIMCMSLSVATQPRRLTPTDRGGLSSQKFTLTKQHCLVTVNCCNDNFPQSYGLSCLGCVTMGSNIHAMHGTIYMVAHIHKRQNPFDRISPFPLCVPSAFGHWNT